MKKLKMLWFLLKQVWRLNEGEILIIKPSKNKFESAITKAPNLKMTKPEVKNIKNEDGDLIAQMTQSYQMEFADKVTKDLLIHVGLK